MPIFDYFCECGERNELIVRRDEIDKQKCPNCGALMIRQFPDTFNFKLVYNNKTDMCSWGHEGYATSKYWDDVKKQKEKEGKITMPVTENIE